MGIVLFELFSLGILAGSGVDAFAESGNELKSHHVAAIEVGLGPGLDVAAIDDYARFYIRIVLIVLAELILHEADAAAVAVARNIALGGQLSCLGDEPAAVHGKSTA